MVQEKRRSPNYLYIALYFLGLGIMIWVLKNISLSHALWYGVPLLFLSLLIAYFSSKKVKSNVHKYLQEKGVTHGIIFPIITILQAVCFIVFLSLDRGTVIINGQKAPEDYMYTEFKSKAALTGLFFLMGIRTILTGWYEKNKASIWGGLGIILFSIVVVYRQELASAIW
ncbi:hypothetical protein N780_13325 [Pontibacillus chungwhensis BH030062]|uniref:Uncharacterized protein n=1 Tax=Pontibacillus chungwhensis BH030062 TaxID=1385513 RepID=A0A0A2V2P9_9BACI|nr:hypothetical protein [Pontibacillus chungwhensis]KGP93318.1 hypothetical protein N780_13325 [Pontibacillus chungwhensis BH030062]